MVRDAQVASSSTEEARVYLVEDDEVVLESICAVLLSVKLRVECFSSAAEFLDAFEPDRPGCLLLDVCLPGMTGLELQKRLLNDGVATPVIFISGLNDISAAVEGMRRGAVDFLEKPCSPHTLLQSVNQALEIDSQERKRHQERAKFEARVATLSAREREVMECLVDGMNAKQVGVELGISRKTVDNHRTSILDKLQVESVAQLVTLALRGRRTEVN